MQLFGKCACCDEWLTVNGQTRAWVEWGIKDEFAPEPIRPIDLKLKTCCDSVESQAWTLKTTIYCYRGNVEL